MLSSHVSEEICDPAIEEHFRRSLEKKYPGYNGRAKSTSPSSLRRENSSSSVPMCGQSISHRLYEDMHMITDKPCGMSMSTPEPKLSVVINSSQGESVTGKQRLKFIHKQFRVLYLDINFFLDSKNPSICDNRGVKLGDLYLIYGLRLFLSKNVKKFLRMRNHSSW